MRGVGIADFNDIDELAVGSGKMKKEGKQIYPKINN